MLRCWTPRSPVREWSAPGRVRADAGATAGASGGRPQLGASPARAHATTLKEQCVGRPVRACPVRCSVSTPKPRRHPRATWKNSLVEGIRARHSKARRGVDLRLRQRRLHATLYPRDDSAARRASRPVLVDPGRDRDFRIYAGATAGQAKPNRDGSRHAARPSSTRGRLASRPAQLCQQLPWTWRSSPWMQAAWPWSNGRLPNVLPRQSPIGVRHHRSR